MLFALRLVENPAFVKSKVMPQDAKALLPQKGFCLASALACNAGGLAFQAAPTQAGEPALQSGILPISDLLVPGRS